MHFFSSIAVHVIQQSSQDLFAHFQRFDSSESTSPKGLRPSFNGEQLPEKAGTDKQRVCAVDIMGLFAVLSLAVRFLSFAGDSCIDIIGCTDDNALCVGLWAGVPGGVLGMAAAGTNLEAACKTAFGKWVPEDWPYEGANMLPSDDFAALAEA